MKTQLTDATRPRIRSGDSTRRIVLRMIMLTPSVTPLQNSATIESQKIVDSPKTIMLTPKPGHADQQGPPGVPARAAAGWR